MCHRGIVALIIVASATSFASLPVTAGGWDFTVRPKGEASRAFGVGLQLYGLARGLKNRAQTRQLGADNGAAIRQYGQSNNALIVQRGKGNAANIAQNGSNNAYGIFQFGSGNSKSVVQNSDGGLGFTFQGNW